MDIISSNLKELDKIFKATGVKFAYVFGSATNSKIKNPTDIDIAVFLKESNKNKRFNVRLKLISELEKIISKPIDLVVINDVSSIFLKYIIISEGKKIFEDNPDERIETECRIHSEYIDFKPFLDEYHNNFLNKKIHD